MTRHPMTPAEFDAAVRELLERCPWLSETSGKRTLARNRRVGGKDASKHVLGMAKDFVGENQRDLDEANKVARNLGFWTEVHDVGSGNHLHIQGLAPGRVPQWWRVKYLGG